MLVVPVVSQFDDLLPIVHHQYHPWGSHASIALSRGKWPRVREEKPLEKDSDDQSPLLFWSLFVHISIVSWTFVTELVIQAGVYNARI